MPKVLLIEYSIAFDHTYNVAYYCTIADRNVGKGRQIHKYTCMRAACISDGRLVYIMEQQLIDSTCVLALPYFKILLFIANAGN